MAFELVQEDGSLVASANTYASANDLAAYAEARGITLPGDETRKAQALIRAMDLIAKFAGQFVGSPVSSTQALDWPRNGIYDDSRLTRANADNPPPLPDTYMPPKLIEAQCAAACADLSGTALMPTVGTSGFVTEETVGPITTKYDRGTDYSPMPQIPAFNNAIRTLCVRRAGLVVGRA